MEDPTSLKHSFSSHKHDKYITFYYTKNKGSYTFNKDAIQNCNAAIDVVLGKKRSVLTTVNCLYILLIINSYPS